MLNGLFRRLLLTGAVVLIFLPIRVYAQGPGGAQFITADLVMMLYANQPGLVDGTVDFRIGGFMPTTAQIGFFNTVADLDSNGEVTPNEWIIRNIPLRLDHGLIEQPMLSAWFEKPPGPLPVELPVTMWLTVSEQQVQDITLYDMWQAFTTLPTLATWGANDPNGQALAPFSPSTSAVADNIAADSKRTGVPDIEQRYNECGPTATANSLRWLAKEGGFADKLPASDDDLIKELMKAMTGSDKRPFPGLYDNQLMDGKKKYAKEKGLPIYVKGGMNDPDASGGKAFDFIKNELKDKEDVEFLIGWPGGGSHWVTALGTGQNGERLFIEVNDPDDGKTGAVEWELKKDGTFVSPKGFMMWAVSESVKPPYTPADLDKAIKIASGIAKSSLNEVALLDADESSDSNGKIDMKDVVRIARKIHGLEPNP